MTEDEALERVLEPAIKVFENIKILPSLSMSQAMLKSEWLKKSFHNNVLGIKCHKGVKCMIGDIIEYIDSSYTELKDYFAVYDSIEDCFKDYEKVMTYVNPKTGKDKYKPVREAENYWTSTDLISKCGYTADPEYTKNLRAIIERKHLYIIDGFIKGVRTFPYADELLKTLDKIKDIKERKNFLIATNFKYGEFWSDNKEEPPKELFYNIVYMASQLQRVRNAINSAFTDRKYTIIITSGWRSLLHNRNNKGADGSNHIMGLACDTRCPGLTLQQYFYFLVKHSNFTGFGIYKVKNFIHSDFGRKIAPKIFIGGE